MSDLTHGTKPWSTKRLKRYCRDNLLPDPFRQCMRRMVLHDAPEHPRVQGALLWLTRKGLRP